MIKHIIAFAVSLSVLTGMLYLGDTSGARISPHGIFLI
jgi:hypothetical protein